jgi:hypothetical protein
MAENDNMGSFGKKIFFLHPPAFVQNQVIAELAQEEFEVYIVKDENRLRQALRKYPDSIVFAGISEGMKENAWEEWIREVMSNAETAGVDVGVLSLTNDENLKRKYLEQLRVHCGFTVIKMDLPTVVKQLIAVLNAVNAKGRRKYIRVIMDSETNTTVNLPLNGTFVNGTIKDISVVGFSCSFTDDPALTKNGLFGDIQLRLQTQLLKVEGIIFGSRVDEGEKTYVVLFTQRTDPEVRARIRKYIQTALQMRMDNELK